MQPRRWRHPLNWQVVSIDRPYTDWMDAPILYLASHVAPSVSEPQIDNLRECILNGGLLYLQADGGSEKFDAFARSLASKLFPDRPMTDVPGDSDLYNSPYKVNPRPALKR